MAVTSTATATIGGPVPPGTIISYLEFTSNVTISGTSGAQTTVVTAPTFVADGVTSYWVEVFCIWATPGTADIIVSNLWEAASDLGDISQAGAATTNQAHGGKRRVTPAAGPRQYIWKAWRSVNNGTINAGAGGALTALPGYISITKAA